MDRLRNILNKIPTLPLTLVAIMLALAPFVPAPHLWEKLVMLSQGELTKAIDIFDMCMHGLPLLILIVKLTLTYVIPAKQGSEQT